MSDIRTKDEQTTKDVLSITPESTRDGLQPEVRDTITTLMEKTNYCSIPCKSLVYDKSGIVG